MSARMVKIEELKRQRPSAWSRLLAQNPQTRGTVVTRVKKEQLPTRPRCERFLLELAGYEEVTVLIGKNTNAAEATFFADLAPHLSELTPYCWLSHVAGDQSWLVLDEVHDDWPPPKWTVSDIELIINRLILLHSEFWEKEEHLARFGIESRLGASISADQGHFVTREQQATDKTGVQPRTTDPRIETDRPAAKRLLSNHALRTVGDMAWIFEQAASGLQAIQLVGGWPGILAEEHYEALSGILDDPVPILYPLRQSPATLSHGDPIPENWSISLFDEAILVDWMDIKIGPGIYDLICFIEQLYLIDTPEENWLRQENRQISEETIIDTYVLGMGNSLGSRFDAREIRELIPAARCLNVIINWLPKFNNWFDLEYVNKETWKDYAQLSENDLNELGFGQLASIRPHLAGVFNRFLEAYHSL